MARKHATRPPRADESQTRAEPNTALESPPPPTARARTWKPILASAIVILAAAFGPGTPPGVASSDPYLGLTPWAGDIHVHTGLALYQVLDPNDPHSIGTVDEILDAAESRGLDFVAITEHTNNLNDPRGVSWREEHGLLFTLPDGTKTASEWEYLQSAIARRNRAGRFVTILGLEYTRGTTETSSPGHQLGLFPKDTLPRYCSNFPTNVGDCPTVRDFYSFVAEQKGIAVMAHPCVKWGPSDWSEMDDTVNSMELVAAKCEFGKDGYNDVLGRGLRIGARGSSDSHHFEVGNNDKTICFSPKLTREAILKAMRANLCYWVDQYPVTLKFTINGEPMGSDVTDRGAGIIVNATAETAWQTNLDHMELIHDGKVAFRADCEDSEYAHCALKTAIPSETTGYYYVAVSNENDSRVAISSPIWVRPAR